MLDRNSINQFVILTDEKRKSLTDVLQKYDNINQNLNKDIEEYNRINTALTKDIAEYNRINAILNRDIEEYNRISSNLSYSIETAQSEISKNKDNAKKIAVLLERMRSRTVINSDSNKVDLNKAESNHITSNKPVNATSESHKQEPVTPPEPEAHIAESEQDAVENEPLNSDSFKNNSPDIDSENSYNSLISPLIADKRRSEAEEQTSNPAEETKLKNLEPNTDELNTLDQQTSNNDVSVPDIQKNESNDTDKEHDDAEHTDGLKSTFASAFSIFSNPGAKEAEKKKNEPKKEEPKIEFVEDSDDDINFNDVNPDDSLFGLTENNATDLSFFRHDEQKSEVTSTEQKDEAMPVEENTKKEATVDESVTTESKTEPEANQNGNRLPDETVRNILIETGHDPERTGNFDVKELDPENILVSVTNAIVNDPSYPYKGDGIATKFTGDVFFSMNGTDRIIAFIIRVIDKSKSSIKYHWTAYDVKANKIVDPKALNLPSLENVYMTKSTYSDKDAAVIKDQIASVAKHYYMHGLTRIEKRSYIGMLDNIRKHKIGEMSSIYKTMKKF